MSDVILGQMPPPDAERDATHVAVVPLEAATVLYPAQRVALLPDGRVKGAAEGDEILGIVDPYLNLPVAPGARPYICLMPRSVVGLRHAYQHPILDKIEDGEPVDARSDMKASTKKGGRTKKERSQDWINQWGAANFINPDDLIKRATAFLAHDEYWVEGGRFEGQGLPAEFWDHYEVVTGGKVSNEKRHSFFSCTC